MKTSKTNLASSRPAWTKSSIIAIAALCLAGFTTSPATAATTTFFDGDFFPSVNNVPTNYAFTEYKVDSYTTQSFVNLGGGFFPDRSFAYGYSKEGADPGGNRLQAFNTTFVYNPATQGVINTIDASAFLKGLASHNSQAVNANYPLALRVLAAQGGSVYEAVTSATAPRNSFVSVNMNGLLANDFFRFDPANPNAPRTLNGLNYGGGAITFGFELVPFRIVNSDGSPLTGTTFGQVEIDNLLVRVNAQDFVPGGVPEPSAWALLILGFGVVGGALRRSRKQRVLLTYA